MTFGYQIMVLASWGVFCVAAIDYADRALVAFHPTLDVGGDDRDIRRGLLTMPLILFSLQWLLQRWVLR